MLDFYNDDHITVNLFNTNTRNNKDLRWYAALIADFGKYYNLRRPHLLPVTNERVRGYFLKFFEINGLEVEYFDFSPTSEEAGDCGFVFKSNAALSALILKHSEC